MRARRVPRKGAFDTTRYVDPDTAALFRLSGYYTCLRYIRTDRRVNDRPDTSPGTWLVSLSRQELAGLLGAHMLVSPVQIGTARNGHKAGHDYGAEKGEAAVYNCESLGLPKGITVWFQAEWSEPHPSPSRQIAHYNALSKQLVDAGYEAGLYVSTGCRLDARQLYHELPYVNHYWRANAITPEVAVRGYQMYQGFQCGGDVDGRDAGPPIHGLVVDQNIVHLDNKGHRFRVAGP
jgi:hypothetical protein